MNFFQLCNVHRYIFEKQTIYNGFRLIVKPQNTYIIEANIPTDKFMQL